MKLNEYLQGSPRGTAAALAVRLRVRPVMVSQWSRAIKAVPIERCAALELATLGAVRRWDLRPSDWWLIWPELIGSEGAPLIAAHSCEAGRGSELVAA